MGEECLLPNASRADTGAVTGVHGAGSSLNIHVHFHVLCADGFYVEEPGANAPSFGMASVNRVLF